MDFAYPSIADSVILTLDSNFLLYVQCRETSALWVSIDVPVEQPPGVYTGEICITAVRAETE